MKRYLITCEETCPTCFGKGELLIKAGQDETPKGKIPPCICSRCSGEKIIRKEVDLSEELTEKLESIFESVEILKDYYCGAPPLEAGVFFEEWDELMSFLEAAGIPTKVEKEDHG